MPTVERIGISLHYESYGTGAPLVFLHPLSTITFGRLVGTVRSVPGR